MVPRPGLCWDATVSLIWPAGSGPGQAAAWAGRRSVLALGGPAQPIMEQSLHRLGGQPLAR